MGAAQSAFNPDRSPQVAIPAGYRTPAFPSLYTPNFDITSRQLGVFLYDAAAIWRFTLYWTLILVCGIYTICALIATVNLFLSSTVFRPMSTDKLAHQLQPPTPLVSLASPLRVSRSHRHQSSSGFTVPPQPGTLPDPSPAEVLASRKTRVQRRTRPPLWPLALIPVIAFVAAAIVALVSATVIGFALAALYSAGGFSMSTWVPFTWAVIIVLILIISYVSPLNAVQHRDQHLGGTNFRRNA